MECVAISHACGAFKRYAAPCSLRLHAYASIKHRSSCYVWLLLLATSSLRSLFFLSHPLSFPQLHMHTADRVSAAKSKYPLHGRNNKLLHSTSRRRRVSPPRVAALHVCNMRTRRLSICFLNKILSQKKRKILTEEKKMGACNPGYFRACDREVADHDAEPTGTR